MKTNIKEDDGLGTTAVPAGYGKPDFSVGDPINPGPNPDNTLAADTATAMSAGDPNPGFSLGGANDPLAEDQDPIAGTVNEEDPSLSGMSEEDPAMEDPSAGEDDTIVEFDSVDEMPEFEEYDELDVAGETVDGSGVIEPEIVSIDVDDPELGAIPDAALPMTEPIVQVEEDEPDIYATEAELSGADPEPMVVSEAFRLPEDRKVVVSKGDQIFFVGHAMNEKTPKFTESAFKRAFRSLVESKNIEGKLSFRKSEGMKKCAIVGRSMLVEVAKDWRLPGTNIVFEAHDILQIVSMTPIVEKTFSEGGKGSGDLDNFGDKKAAPFKKEENEDKKECGSTTEGEESEEEKKAKKEMFLAKKRYLEAKAKREAAKKSEDDEPKADPEKDDDGKKDDDDKKKTEAYLRRNGIYF